MYCLQFITKQNYAKETIRNLGLFFSISTGTSELKLKNLEGKIVCRQRKEERKPQFVTSNRKQEETKERTLQGRKRKNRYKERGGEGGKQKEKEG